MTSKSWFENVRECALQIKESESKLEETRELLGVYNSGGTSIGHSSAVLDPMRHVDEYLDLYRETDQINSEARETIANAYTVINGLKLLNANDAARIIELRYIRCWGWPRIADRVNHSMVDCKSLCKSVFAWMDEIGLKRLSEIGAGEIKSA